MILEQTKSRLAKRLGTALVAALALAAATGCGSTQIDRAIRARGGPLTSLEREADATVYREFPGEWSWEMGYRVPDLFRWTLHVSGEDQSYVDDGHAVTLFLGSAALPVDAAAAASFRTQARFVGVTMLDVVARSGDARLAEIAPGELPPGAARGVRVRYAGDGLTYDLFFDAADLLVAASGPVSMPPVGAGILRAEYSDFRVVDGYTLPYRVRYTLDGAPLADERVKDLVPNSPELGEASFATGG